MDLNTVETWRFINSFAPWLAGIGTLAAVLISLYLAFGRTRVRLRVSAAHRITVWPNSPNDEIVEIKVVNHGFCDAQITEIVWKVGTFRKRHLLQVFNFSPRYLHLDNCSDSLPKRLSHGDQARYIIPFDPWIGFFQPHLQPHPWLWTRLLSIQVGTSVGQTRKGSVEKGLKAKILESLRRLQKTSKKKK